MGNEYFLGALSASSASAAASCSTIAELGSPLINARVSGRCARFLTPQSGRRSITEAARRDSCDAHQGHLDAIQNELQTAVQKLLGPAVQQLEKLREEVITKKRKTDTGAVAEVAASPEPPVVLNKHRIALAGSEESPRMTVTNRMDR